MRVVAIIPALDEEASIGEVVRALPPLVDETIVVDNGSRDRTAEVAREAGARVVAEPRRGYGQACLAGIAAAGDADVLAVPRRRRQRRPGAGRRRCWRRCSRAAADLVIGSRRLGAARAGLAPLARGARHAAVRRADEPAVRLARPRTSGPFRAVSADGAAPARDARPRLRLDGRDAGQGRAARPARASRCPWRTGSAAAAAAR